MPNALTDYSESGILTHIFRSTTFSKPSRLAIALCRNVPTDAQTGATIPEVANTFSYDRKDMGAPSDSVWDAVVTNGPGGSGYVTNTSTITFAAANGGDWGWVSGCSVVDSFGYGSGNVLFKGALETPREVRNGDTFSFAPGALRVYAK